MIGAPLLIWLSLLAGITLIIAGWRGRRVSDHPHCRSCGFDLVGVRVRGESPRGPSPLCPECGALFDARVPGARPRPVKRGRRARRWRVLLVGALLLAPPIVYGGWRAAPLVLGPRANPYEPVRLLSWDLTHPRENVRLAAADELMSRYVDGSLRGRAMEVALGGVLAQQRSGLAWDSLAGDLFEQAYLDGRVSEELWTRFAFNAVGPVRVRLRNRVHSGGPTPMSYTLEMLNSARSRDPRYYIHRPAGTMGAVCYTIELVNSNAITGGRVELVDGREVRNSGVLRPMYQWGGIMPAGPQIPEPFPLRTLELLDAAPGPAEVELIFRVTIVHPLTGEPIASRDLTARAETLVLPADRPLVELRSDPAQRARVAQAFTLDHVELLEGWEEGTVQVRLEGARLDWPAGTPAAAGAFTFRIILDAESISDSPRPLTLPIRGASYMDMVGHGGGGSTWGEITVPGGDAHRLEYWKEPKEAKLILVPDVEELLRLELDLPESVWGEPVEVGPFPVRWAVED